MILLYETMLKAFPKLNQKEYSFEDVQRITKRERIKLNICPYDPNILGYFCTRKSGKRIEKFIVINESLCEIERTFIGLHELVHFHDVNYMPKPKSFSNSSLLLPLTQFLIKIC